MTDDYQFYYNSPKNPRCWNCGEPIKFNPNRRGKNERPIPLNPYTDEPHRCKESITPQERTVITKIESDGHERIGCENQNKYPNKVRLDLPPQHIIAELPFPNPTEYNEIKAKLDNLTNRVEKLEQNRDRSTEINRSSLDNDDHNNTNKNQSITEDQNV